MSGLYRSALIAAAIALGAAVPGNTQPQRRGRIIIRPQIPPEHGPRGRYTDVDYPTPEKRTANLSELLAFSEEQKTKVQAIFVEQDKQTTAVWSDDSLTTEARTRKIDDLRDAAMKQVRALLTDDQKRKYDDIAADPQPHTK